MSYKPDGLVETILVDYRWIFVCLFLLPLSLFFNSWLFLRNWAIFYVNSAPRKHQSKVQHVQKQVSAWNQAGRSLQICTSRPGWQTVCFRRPAYKDGLKKIDVNLVDVLEINTETPSVKVEPLVTMGQLTATLNPLGWTIPVVPEIDDLTIGGLIMGTGIESSSHRHGLFQHICLSYELVLADGSVVVCSPSQQADLFYSVPWSYGTLGILTCVEIRLIAAKPFVRISYEPIVGSAKDIEQSFLEASRNEAQNEFVETLVFNKKQAVMMRASQVSAAEPSKINKLGKWYKPWFFLHVKSMLKNDAPVVEYIPLRDYYHRHTRSIFWELQDIIPFGNHLLFRLLFGWLMPPKISLLKLTQTEAIKRLYENNHVIQDMLIPCDKLEQCIDLFDKLVGVYPLWLCPFKLFNNPGMVHPADATDEQLYVDVGVYGVPTAPDFHPVKTTRRLEQFVMECKGFQMLYADTYLSRDEFRNMFDHRLYDRLRNELRCRDAFPEVYDKVSKAARY